MNDGRGFRDCSGGGADALGTSVDIYGNLAVAGAPKAQAQNGAFKEFVRDNVFQNGFNG